MQALMEKTRVLIVDDHELTCRGLRLMLQEKEDIDVAGVARCAREGIDHALGSHPDIVLMDVMMPDMDGVTATRILKKALPACRVIMLTSNATLENAHAAISAKVSAFCHKDISLDNLYHLIHLVGKGGFWLDPVVSSAIMHTMPVQSGSGLRLVATGDVSESGQPGTRQEFTRREKEIVRLLMSGKSNKEISENLQISIYTVKAHLNHIYKKLGISDRTQVAIKALQENIFS
ncbi:MAG TPA: response regulator transcription factor [Coleofasciculaceae cyanobacterium]|jgi:DNA-binding NarL/FixJ family response regulator